MDFRALRDHPRLVRPDSVSRERSVVACTAGARGNRERGGARGNWFGSGDRAGVHGATGVHFDGRGEATAVRRAPPGGSAIAGVGRAGKIGRRNRLRAGGSYENRHSGGREQVPPRNEACSYVSEPIQVASQVCLQRRLFSKRPARVQRRKLDGPGARMDRSHRDPVVLHQHGEEHSLTFPRACTRTHRSVCCLR